MVALKTVVCQVPVLVAAAYCTDQPVAKTVVLPRLNNSMKSFLNVAPLFPPPPYTWLMMMLDEGVCGGMNAAVSSHSNARARNVIHR